MAQITIPGGQGPTINVNITGNAASNLAGDFSAAAHGATIITELSSGGDESTVAGALNLIGISGNTSYVLAAGRQYTYASVTSPTQITGSFSGGDTVLAGGDVTYDAQSGDDRVTFVSGNNVFNGNNTAGNTISGGAGNDIIATGSKSATVFSGTGNTTINLGDTVGGDIAVLLAGNSTVAADGINDTVYASAAYGGASAEVMGGAGQLYFVAGSSESTLPITVVGGSGDAYMFGNAGSDITFENTGGKASFMAGAGNETLSGANAAAGFAFFGDTIAGDAASINDSIVGGAGADFFSTGGGNETIVAGQGTELFQINDLGPNTHITIADLHANDFFKFASLTVLQEQTLLHDLSTVTGGNLTVTLQDGTKVEFLAVTSFTGQLT